MAFRTGMKYIDVIMEKKKTPEISKKMRHDSERKAKIRKEIAKLIRFEEKLLGLEKGNRRKNKFSEFPI